MKNKLPKAFKAKWLKALKSGKFKKGKEYLESDNRYCCLGVACKISGAIISGNPNYIQNDEYGKIKGIRKVPLILRGYYHYSVSETLATLNDKNETFKEVIEYIEKEL